MDELDFLLNQMDEFSQEPYNKDKKMSEKTMNFRVEYSEYETYDDALIVAQKRATKAQEDVVIWSKYSTVKYPVPAFEVEIAATPAVA